MAESEPSMRYAARHALFRAGLKLGKFVLRRTGKPADILGEYGRAYAFSLLWRRELERLGHEKEAAALSIEIRRELSKTPLGGFTEDPTAAPEPDG